MTRIAFTIRPHFPAAPDRYPEFKEDIPSEEWLQEQADYAKEKGTLPGYQSEVNANA
ncbi:MAG: hypothetical protein H0X43_10790 [Nitrosospira sp.]|nr:hypothetical protein [Nitrosospira sp.]